MNCKFLKLAIIPALLIGIACSSHQRTADNANTTNAREGSYQDSVKKALEQADLKDVNVDEDKNKNTITVPQMWHFMPQRFPNSGWKRLACWVAPCTVQVAHGVWRHRDAGVLPRVAGSN